MSEDIYEEIQGYAEHLKLNAYTKGLASFVDDEKMGPQDLVTIRKVFEYLSRCKKETMIETLLRMSHMPVSALKSFDDYNFDRISGRDIDQLRNLPALSAIYANRNIAFIGPPGLGKTHLAMAYGQECCKRGLKTYFIKASELSQRLRNARKYGREGGTINGLVRPSCLIIDEIGRCKFDRECTRMFFDVVDRRYSKEGPNCMIFTSNKSPNEWSQYFDEEDSLLAAMDRVFDNADIFVMNGESYRGQTRQTYEVGLGIDAQTSVG